jgi:polyhydroxybutyrate depolymerase
MRLRAIALAAAVVAAGLAVGYRFLVHVPRPELPALSGELRRGVLRSGGRERSYAVYVPAALAPRPALVLALHGSMGDGGQMREGTYYRFDELADRDGFAVAYPDGFEQHWNDCRRVAPYRANTLDVDDVGFLRALVARLEAELGVDPARVYATGMSNGGQMAYRLALEAPELVAAVAPVAAGLPDAANLDCSASGRPVAILIVNGTLDPMNPFAGGRVALYGLWGDRGTVLSSDASAAWWAGLAGHRAPPERRRYPDASRGDASWAELVTWSDGPGPEVAHLVVHGGGHTFPHPRWRYPRFIGPTNHDVDAAGEIWGFFTRQRGSAGASGRERGRGGRLAAGGGAALPQGPRAFRSVLGLRPDPPVRGSHRASPFALAGAASRRRSAR